MYVSFIGFFEVIVSSSDDMGSRTLDKPETLSGRTLEGYFMYVWVGHGEGIGIGGEDRVTTYRVQNQGHGVQVGEHGVRSEGCLDVVVRGNEKGPVIFHPFPSLFLSGSGAVTEDLKYSSCIISEQIPIFHLNNALTQKADSKRRLTPSHLPCNSPQAAGHQ
ncbi:hypothetical protein J6590_075644 [Homalodisca vitripennis]|nr:hypothetical protein J6590_075644 [Homalodisca vitripennis]